MFGLSSTGGSRPIVIVLSAFAVLAIAGTTIALGAARYRAVVNPDTTVSYTGNSSGPIVQGVQNGTGPGMEGVVGQSAGAIGILGFATDLVHPEVALEGLAFGPTSVGLYGQGLHNADTTHPTIGLLGTSTSGIGVEGESLVAAGTGVFGTASDGLSSGSLGIGGAAGALGTSARGYFLDPGVDGESTIRGAEDTAGAFGLGIFAVTPNVPVHGVLGYGTSAAILGYTNGPGASGTNVGVEGSEFNAGSQSFPDLNIGVLGVEDFGTGTVGESGGVVPTAGYLGNFPIGQYAVSGIGSTGASVSVASILEGADANSYSMFAVNDSTFESVAVLPAGGGLLEGSGTTGSFVFDGAGNLHLSGLLFTSGFCNPGCAKPHTVGGKRVITYAAQTSEPTVEDFGEGRIVGGAGQVALDPAFARTIDATRSYLVFLTPEGDNRGLYVTQRTASGFTVRESQNGSSTLSFMYRIVAKPYGVTAARLPMVEMPSSRLALHAMPVRHVAQPMEPYAALVKEVGKVRAAQILAQFRANYDARLRMLKALPHADANGTLHMGTTSVAAPRINN